MNDGGSFSALTVIVNVWLDSLMPPLSVPPSSPSVAVTSALPLASGTGVKVRVPVALSVGPLANNAGLSLDSPNCSA